MHPRSSGSARSPTWRTLPAPARRPSCGSRTSSATTGMSGCRTPSSSDLTGHLRPAAERIREQRHGARLDDARRTPTSSRRTWRRRSIRSTPDRHPVVIERLADERRRARPVRCGVPRRRAPVPHRPVTAAFGVVAARRQPGRRDARRWRSPARARPSSRSTSVGTTDGSSTRCRLARRRRRLDRRGHRQRAVAARVDGRSRLPRRRRLARSVRQPRRNAGAARPARRRRRRRRPRPGHRAPRPAESSWRDATP